MEVKYPADQQDDSNLPFRIRYIYDLTQDGGQGANLQVGSGPLFRGHGNLYKTQRYYVEVHNSNKAWYDVNGNASDAADRPVHRYQYTPTTASSGSTPGQNPGPLETWDTNFDENNESGLLTSVNDPSGTQQATFSYNALGKLSTKSFSDSTPTASYTYDPDGHLASASNSVASDTYVYDANGNMLSDTEGTVSDPATLTYNYYANGWRKKVSVSDPGASYSSSDTYSYRQDGLRETLAMDSQANPFSWTYTPAGREKSQSDPATGSTGFSSPYFPNGVSIGPKKESYDSATGVLTSLTMPDGLQYEGPKQGPIGYDPEEEPTGLTMAPPPGFSPGSSLNDFITAITYSYDSRGELYQTIANGDGKVFSNGPVTLTQSQFSFDHAQCESALDGCGGCILNCGGVSSVAVDENTGAVIVGQGGILGSGSGEQCRWGQFPSYDADGREATLIKTTTSFGSCNAGPPAVVDSRTYDAENHMTNDCSSTYQQGGCQGPDTMYKWGPRGELRLIDEGYGLKYTIHWDGNNVALSTDAHNNPSRYVEKLAAAGNGQLIIYDRDFGGTTVVESHTKTGDSGVTIAPSYTVPTGKWTYVNVAGTYPPSGNPPGAPPSLGIARVDGYSDGLLNSQGARVYDGNLGQWGTPDAYKGNLDNPRSQWEYEWNSNNPITESDPTGYSSEMPLSMAPFQQVNGQIEAHTEDGNTMTYLPFSDESAAHGQEWVEEPAAAFSGTVVGLAFEEFGPEVSIPVGHVSGQVIGGGLGAAAYVWCGYAQCDAPPAWWDGAWKGTDLVGNAFELDFSRLQIIATVTSRTCYCPVGTNMVAPNGFSVESFEHIGEATALYENSTEWAYGNADPYDSLKL